MNDRAATSCLFCQIAAGQAPADIVAESEAAVAFLDARPLFAGHCLLAPREHHETLPDLPPDLVAPLFGEAQILARAMEQALECDGTFVAINNRVSQSVPHLHVHVVPRRRKDGLKGFFWPRHSYSSDAEREEVARKLRNAISLLKAGR